MGLGEDIEKVKRELVDIIIGRLKEKKISSDAARKLASDFLQALPIVDYQDLLLKLKTLGDKYPEAKVVYIDELRIVNDIKRDEALIHIRNLIAQGDLEKAILTAKNITK